MTSNSQSSGWKVSYDAKPMTNSVTVALDADAKHGAAMTNKMTNWSFTGTPAALSAIAVDSSVAVTGTGAAVVGLDVHPSTLTYGWTVTVLTAKNIKESAFVGLAMTPDNTAFKVRVEADMAASKVNALGVGSTGTN